MQGRCLPSGCRFSEQIIAVGNNDKSHGPVACEASSMPPPHAGNRVRGYGTGPSGHRHAPRETTRIRLRDAARHRPMWPRPASSRRPCRAWAETPHRSPRLPAERTAHQADDKHQRRITHDQETETPGRVLSGAGRRYGSWRQFGSHPDTAAGGPAPDRPDGRSGRDHPRHIYRRDCMAESRN